MNKYIIKIDDESNINQVLYTFDYTDEDIELSREEYEKASKYEKFNPKTREFYEPKPLTELPLNKEETWKNQVEQAIGTLAMQVAKNTLLTGGN